MTRGGAYVHHRYGKAGGTAKVQGRGGVAKAAQTDKVMSDKLRYAATRFAGENNALHTESGGQFADWREAWQEVCRGAAEVAATNIRGRSKNAAFVYDTTLNAGDGRISHDRVQEMARQYIADLRARGYRVQGVAFAVHDNGRHTHVHLMYATHKTLQRADSAGLRTQVREAADKAKSQERSAQRDDDHDRGARGRG